MKSVIAGYDTLQKATQAVLGLERSGISIQGLTIRDERAAGRSVAGGAFVVLGEDAAVADAARALLAQLPGG